MIIDECPFYIQKVSNNSLFFENQLCLFVSLDFFVPLENVSIIWRRTITGEWLQIFNLCSAPMPLSSKGSLSCHTYCDMGHPRTHDTHTYCQTFGSGAVTYCFYDLGLSQAGFKYPTFRLRCERSNPLRHRCGCYGCRITQDS